MPFETQSARLAQNVGGSWRVFCLRLARSVGSRSRRECCSGSTDGIGCGKARCRCRQVGVDPVLFGNADLGSVDCPPGLLHCGFGSR